MIQVDFMGKNNMDVCPISENCGGCIYQGVPYEEQLAEKNR